jgi:hypothetical protein
MVVVAVDKKLLMEAQSARWEKEWMQVYDKNVYRVRQELTKAQRKKFSVYQPDCELERQVADLNWWKGSGRVPWKMQLVGRINLNSWMNRTVLTQQLQRQPGQW